MLAKINKNLHQSFSFVEFWVLIPIIINFLNFQPNTKIWLIQYLMPVKGQKTWITFVHSFIVLHSLLEHSRLKNLRQPAIYIPRATWLYADWLTQRFVTCQSTYYDPRSLFTSVSQQRRPCLLWRDWQNMKWSNFRLNSE